MRLSHLVPVLLLIVGLGACRNAPNHARYIPADATAVLGINTNAMGKKIAWSKITGSNILADLEKEAAESGSSSTAFKDLEASGIDFGSTLYLYGKLTPAAGNRAVGVLPLKSSGDWEAYVKKTFPKAASKKAGDRTEARLSPELYAGWSDDVLILMSGTAAEPDYSAAINDTSFSTPMPEDRGGVDDVALAAEMQQVFALKKDASIVDDKRFGKLEAEGHDMSLWINYEGLMSNMMAQGGSAGMLGGGMASLYENTAFGMGFDFEKGQIDGDAVYYVSEKLREVYKDMGDGKVDAALLDRVNPQALNALVAWKMSPQGMRSLFEKMGYLGMVNMALGEQGITLDDILESFAGDIVFAMNDFSVASKTDTLYGTPYTTSSPDFGYTVAFKVGKREKLDKLLALAVRSGAMRAAGAGVYLMGGEDGGATDGALVIKGDLAAFAKTQAAAVAYLDKKAGGKLPEPAREAVTGTAMGMFVDMQTMLARVGGFSSASDSMMVDAVRRTFGHVAMHSTGASGDRFTYEMEAAMMNKNENALVSLLDFAVRVRRINAERRIEVQREMSEEMMAPSAVPMDDAEARVEQSIEEAQ